MIVSLGEAGLDHYFSQQSDQQLADLAADIDPSLMINGGSSADERRDFFNLLAKGLSPANRKRWSAHLSEGLGHEFDNSVAVFSEPQNRSLLAQDSQSYLDEPESSWSRPASLQVLDDLAGAAYFSAVTPTANHTATSVSAPVIPDGVHVEAGDSLLFREGLSERYERYMALIEGLPGDQRSASDRNELAAAMVNVEAGADRVRAGTMSWEDLADTIVDANKLFIEKGYGRLVGSGNDGGISVTYYTRYPPAMGVTRDSRKYHQHEYGQVGCCLLYTSDAADDTPCVDLGGRRLI